jgi:hypothetical protein
MIESHVPPPMNLRTWFALLLVALATVCLGLHREANSMPLDAATFARPVEAAIVNSR